MTPPTRFRTSPGPAEWTAVALVVAGLGAIAAAWKGAAGQVTLALQVPYLLSGAFAGLGLIVFALVVAHVEVTRRLAAEEEATVREIATAAARVVVSLRDAGGSAVDT